jgi:hypothetical protein
MENNKREIYFLNILIPEALSIEIATQANEYAQKHIEATPNKNWYPTNAEEIKAFPVYKLSWVFYNPLPKTCTDTKINCSIRQLLK